MMMFVTAMMTYIYISYVFCRSLIMFVMENALYLVMSQAMRLLRDPSLPQTDKQLLKRELGTEMVHVLSIVVIDIYILLYIIIFKFKIK